ncbi:MAG TPA: quinoprotein relay system zinc metallohydrolase 2 [Roseiarcus sp.]|nr:quinoprotein relay system zinc metallohydrolase 2 [Roseiarcus sp.]
MLRRAIMAALLLCSGVAPAVAQDFALAEIAPGVYAHEGQMSLMTEANKGDIANLGAIVGEEAIAVIDTGGSLLEGEAFLAALRHKSAKPIRYVINTHAHPDHVFGNGAFVAPGVTFVGHANLPRALAERGDYYLKSFRETMAGALDGVTIVAPTLTVETTTTIDLGGRKVTLQAWRAAHSDCDLTVLDETSGTLFAGDLLFLRHVPIVDASLVGFLDVADRLSQIPARQAVAGHGPLVAPWPQALEDERAYLQRLAGDLRAAIKKGDTVADAAATAGQSEKPRWRLFDDYNARNATAGFAELEWEP